MPNAIGLMKDVIATYANDPKWIDAPLGDIKILPNRTRFPGVIGVR